MEVHRITKKFSIIHVPFLSFFSKELYTDVGLYWKGVGFAYLLLLLAICWIPTMVRVHLDFSDFINNEAPAIIEQVPEITITDGEVSIQETQPYYIKAPENDDVVAIIDTTGKITSLQDPNALCLLMKTKVMWRQSKYETRTIELSQVKSFVLDSDRIMHWLHIAGKLLLIAMYPFALLGSYVYRIVLALIFAAIGLLFAALCKVSLSYVALLRLTIVAMTPCIIIKTVFGLAGILLPYAWFIYLLVTLAYLYFGVNACSQIPPAEQEFRFLEQTEI